MQLVLQKRSGQPMGIVFPLWRNVTNGEFMEMEDMNDLYEIVLHTNAWVFSGYQAPMY